MEKKSVLLPFADKEIIEALMYWMRHLGISIKLGEEVVKIEIEKQGRVVTRLKSGKLAASENSSIPWEGLATRTLLISRLFS